MKIAICASLEFTHKISEIAEKLEEQDHEVIIPKTAELILEGELRLEKIKEEKDTGTIVKRAKRLDVIRHYFKKIRETDAVLVLNYDKQGTKNYIGGNVFLEMGFAHVLNKKIFLLNGIPKVPYKDEIEVMDPIILHGELSLE
ncbi:MAG: hypothetical protein U9N35_01635 [Euryarchaeota archaeon]|nr:hypothetical protein [Euryarchaeota archaeon]